MFQKMILALTMVASQSQAAITPRSLGDAMKLMNDSLRSIAAQATNPAMNPQSAILADEFVESATAAKAFLPDTITALPAAERTLKAARYATLMETTIDQGKLLAAAFRANDNVKASALMNDMKSNRNTGHTEFRPPRP